MYTGETQGNICRVNRICFKVLKVKCESQKEEMTDFHNLKGIGKDVAMALLAKAKTLTCEEKF